MFFQDWESIWRTIVAGVLAYVGLILLLRISGKRTLSKMNAFDFVVTIALGSMLATIVLSRDDPLAQGMTALGTLIVLQFVVAWLSVRSKRFSGLVKSEPTLLLYRGSYLSAVLQKERVTEEEVASAVRSQGIASMDSVLAVVLETNGNLTVVGSDPTSLGSSLHSLKNFPPDAAI